MRTKLMLILVIALVSPGIGVAGDPAKSAGTASELVAKIAKLRVGSSTQSEVVQFLGRPSRTIDTNDDPDDDDYRVWEYVGQDATEWFRIHIGFDEDNTVRLIARIPQKGPVQVLSRSDSASDQHKHDPSVHGHDK